MPDTPTPSAIIFFANGNTAVCDQHGQQMPAFQTTHAESIRLLREAGYDWRRFRVDGTPMPETPTLTTGDHVRKVSGYTFAGTVVGVFTTLAGLRRVVVEQDDSGGLLHIFAEGQLEPVPRLHRSAAYVPAGPNDPYTTPEQPHA